MKIDDCYSLGYIKKTIQRDGSVVVFLDVDDPMAYQTMESVLIETPTGLIPYFIERIQIRNNKEAVVKFEGIDNEDIASLLKGKSLWNPLSRLPKLSGNRFYFHEIVGWRVVDEEKGEIGKIKDVLENSVQPLFQIIHPMGKEILIPIHDDILKKVDRDQKVIEINVPEGLLDVYLS